MIKVLAGDPYEFKRVMKEIRKLLYTDIGRLPTDFEETDLRKSSYHYD